MSVSVLQGEPVDLANVPEAYHDLRAVFSKSRASSLPPHRPYDCAIELLPGTSPRRGAFIRSPVLRGRPWRNTSMNLY